MVEKLCYWLMVVFAASVPFPAESETDTKRLQGTWQETSIRCSGSSNYRDATPGASTGARVGTQSHANEHKRLADFRRDSLVFNRTSFLVKVDQTKTPKQIELTPLDGPFKGIKHMGIYELKRDTLRICIGDHTRSERPTEFAAPPDSRLILITLVRGAHAP